MKLELQNVGQLESASVEFGDLTVLVGPQASGKSIFLQFLKLCVDTRRVVSDLRKHGQVWQKNLPNFMDLYFGEGMKALWRTGEGASQIVENGAVINLEDKLNVRMGKKDPGESLFYIPAQRVLALNQQGWWRHFGDYRSADPYVVKAFSENIRLLMEAGLGSRKEGGLFPQKNLLKNEIRKEIDKAIFHGFRLVIDDLQGQKRLILKSETSSIPFMAWSAGQREFVPLLLGLYWLLPSAKVPKRKGVDWVIIEEIEMGLHPRAISSAMIAVLDLVSRGYKVVLSSHSPHVLDIMWGIRMIQKHKASAELVLDMFDLNKTFASKNIALTILLKSLRSFYFDPEPKRGASNTTDITELDPGADSTIVAGWGGLSEFSGRIADIVAKVVSQDKAGNQG